MSKPFLSIVCPTKDRPECVEELLKSLSYQTFQDYEVIISDNAEFKPCKDVVEKVNEADSRVHYYRTDKTLGLCDSFEAASQHASGRFVMFVEDKTLLYSQALEKISNVLKTEKTDILNFPTDFLQPIDSTKNLIQGTLMYAGRSGRLEKVNKDEALKEKFSCEIMCQQLDKEWSYGAILGGVYSESLIKRIRNINCENRLFDGIVPDRFLAVVALLLTEDDKIFYLDDHIEIFDDIRISNKQHRWSYEKLKNLFQNSREGKDYYNKILFPQIPLLHNILASDFIRAQEFVRNSGKVENSIYEIPKGKVLAILEKIIDSFIDDETENKREKELMKKYYAEFTIREKEQYDEKWNAMRKGSMQSGVEFENINVNVIEDIVFK